MYAPSSSSSLAKRFHWGVSSVPPEKTPLMPAFRIVSIEITLRRDMTYDDTQVLAKESEEALLYEDMKSDAVQQVLRRLSVVQMPA